MKRTGIVVGVIALVVVLGSIGAFLMQKNTSQSSVSPSQPTTTQSASSLPVSAQPIKKNVVYIKDQKPGETLVVESATMGDPGYIVIYRDNAGELGSMIGQSSLLSGTVNRLAIRPTESVQSGDRLYGVLHRDNGNKSFDGTDADPIVTQIGSRVLVTFEITDNPIDRGFTE